MVKKRKPQERNQISLIAAQNNAIWSNVNYIKLIIYNSSGYEEIDFCLLFNRLSIFSGYFNANSILFFYKDSSGTIQPIDAKKGGS